MRVYLLCLLIGFIPAASHAVIVKLDMRPGISASAEYVAGQRDKPAVLLLHGFLQTRDFAVVSALARGLEDAGYPVLTPTLSLGIPGRVQSLACEAAHRHSMDDDIQEIARWVGWLKAQGHRAIVLVGHSFGSLQMLAYLDARPDRAVKAFIGASLVETRIDTTVRPALIARLESRLQGKRRELVTQSLSFCKQYRSTADGLLSYVRWDQGRVLMALKRAPVEVRLIMGSADTMIGQGWLKALQHVQIPLVVVPGASHFMDGEHEFDLLEHTLAFLEQTRQGPSR